MKQPPVISVVVCTYNQQDTIGRTLDSILMQQCHVPFEIVIGEDCSTDDTLAVCQSYADRYPDTIRLLANQQNKGVVNNYFDCVEAARGEYIADCAGDDFWTDALKLEKEVTLLKQHPEVTLVHTNWTYYNETTRTTMPSGEKPFTEPFTRGLKMAEDIIIQSGMPVIHLCTALYRRRVLMAALKDDVQMFRNPEYGCEDVQVTLIMALQGVIAYLPDVTLSYSIGHESVTTSVDHHKLFCFYRRVTSLSYYLSEKYRIRSVRTDAFFRQRLFELAMHAFRAHDKGLLKEVLDCERAWNIERTARLQLLFNIMRQPVLWTMALGVRKAVVTLKQVSR